MKLSGADLAVTAAVLLGSAALLGLFVEGLDAPADRRSGRPIGTVIFKKLAATRKAARALGWERMKNDSPVYDADTLRTAKLSEAVIDFEDGSSLDVLENSMLKLNFRGPEKSLEFLSGEISLKSLGEDSSYAISSSGGTLKVTKGSAATLSSEEGRLSVEVSRGSASLVQEGGEERLIAENQELQVDLKSGRAEILSRSVKPLSPERNARFLLLGGGEASLDFAWAFEDGESGEAKAGEEPAFSLELSPDKDFEGRVLDFPGRGSRLSLPLALQGGPSGALAPGTWYWRVRGETGEASAARRFSLELDEAPRPAFPPDGEVYSYRRVPPLLRFSWTETKAASAYLFELSSEPSFASPLKQLRSARPSIALDELGEGDWYWRATPLHACQVLGEAPPPAPSRIRVVKSGDMAAAEPLGPLDGALFQVQDADGLGLSFAWAPQAEARSYELLVSSSPNLDKPFARLESSLPYARLTGELCAAIRRPGRFYWGILWKDKEGNLSPPSAARSLSGVDGSIAIRQSFPPEGFRIADSLVSSTRFTWKSNVPARTLFQVATEPGFAEPLYEEPAGSEAALGQAWPSGSYYWRLSTRNADGSVFLETPARGFRVVDPFPGPRLLDPKPESLLYLRSGERKLVSWQRLDGADYYGFKLYSEADGFTKALVEASFLEKAELELALGDLPGGRYRASIQGFASSADDQTRVIGYIGDNPFAYRRLGYLEPLAPPDGAVIPGLTMRRMGEVFSFGSAERPDEAEILVYGDAGLGRLLRRLPAREGQALVSRLPPGEYYWKAAGRLVGYDISAKESRRFSVEAIPPLPGPAGLQPAGKAVFGPAELRAARSILLSWSPVEGATEYRLTLSPKGAAPLLLLDGYRETSYRIEDLSILDRGDYAWRVEALAFDREGELEQSGRESISEFSIALPELKKTEVKVGTSYFGH